MSYERRVYDEASPADQMSTDCAEVGRALHLDTHPQPAPRRRTPGYTGVDVSDDLAARAAGLELHFD